LIYLPHTFELSLILNTDKFYKWQSKACEKAEDKHRVYQKNGICYDYALKDQGIKIEYHDNTYKKRLNLS
jgi:hypothetical protein